MQTSFTAFPLTKLNGIILYYHHPNRFDDVKLLVVSFRALIVDCNKPTANISFI